MTTRTTDGLIFIGNMKLFGYQISWAQLLYFIRVKMNDKIYLVTNILVQHVNTILHETPAYKYPKNDEEKINTSRILSLHPVNTLSALSLYILFITTIHNLRLSVSTE
ncbi:hypothetical protein V6Z11_A11G190800 [Gossypium hirsutum]